MMIRTSVLRLILAGMILAAAGQAWSIQGLNVSPGSAGINARVSFPTIRPDPASLPPRPTFRDLFRGTVPRVSFSPSSFAPT